jgi:hypothetical protein
VSIMPGAVWRPITIPGGNPGTRTKGRAVVLHVAASEATSLFGFFNNNPNANSHFYVNKAGVIEQMVDTDLQSWASMAANRTTISVETQGGVTNPDGEPWTAAQVAALARICAWAHATEGVPLAVMPNSLPTSRGIGYHRLGIDPWRIAGGETWSGSRGKLCPGAAKIAQIPQIIAAASGATPTPTPAPEVPDMRLVRNKDDGSVYAIGEFSVQPVPNPTVWAAYSAAGFVTPDITGAQMNVLQVQAQAARNALLGDVHRNVLCRTPDDRSGAWLWDRVAGVDDKTAQIAGEVGQGQPVSVDAAAVAQALGSNSAALDALAEAIAAKIATRLGNG